jgi:hypothetical protein
MSAASAGGERLRTVSEVGLAGPRHAHDAVAVGQSVQVLLQDLVLGDRALQGHGPEHLDPLVPQAVRTSVDPLHELLGDRRRAAAPPPRDHVGHRRPQHRDDIDPVVGEEATVLRREHGRDQRGRDLGERHPALIDPVAAHHPQQRSLSIEHAHGGSGAHEAVHVDEVPVAHHELEADIPHNNDRGRDRGAPRHAAPHRVTVRVIDALRATVDSEYSVRSSAGGSRKRPAVVARTP